MTSPILSTKKIVSLLLISLLSACGGDSSAPQENPVLASSMSSERASVKTPATIPGERRAYDIAWADSKITGTSKVSQLNSFQSTETEIRLPDISLSFDQDGPAGKIYRLYQAAFGRTPDVSGLGYWKDAFERNGFQIFPIAEAFLSSAESLSLYGLHSSDATFVENLYLNVLHRKPDQTGSSYWVSRLSSGAKRADILSAFADSPENRSATSLAISKGMAFAQPGIAYIPVANATGPGDVAVSVPFQVNGYNSTDANGDPIYYNWTIVSKPAGSRSDFLEPYIASPRLSLDLPGEYEIAVTARDAISSSYSPGQITVVAHAIITDSGVNKCSAIGTGRAQDLYSKGHTYLDRNLNGVACDAPDIAFESTPPVPVLADTGRYSCASVSAQTAFLLYLQGHTYLDRDRDGKPCEAKDIALEKPVYTPPPTYIPPTTPSTGKRCWVNGYTKKNGTRVSGYYRSC